MWLKSKNCSTINTDSIQSMDMYVYDLVHDPDKRFYLKFQMIRHEIIYRFESKEELELYYAKLLLRLNAEDIEDPTNLNL